MAVTEKIEEKIDVDSSCNSFCNISRLVQPSAYNFYSKSIFFYFFCVPQLAVLGSTIGTRQTEYHEAIPSSANVQSHLTSFADDGIAS